MGIPEMEAFWTTLSRAVKDKTASKNEKELFQRLGKTLVLLSSNPKHPSLKTHDIEELTKRYGIKVWQSYLENNTSSARRLFWVYGPKKNDITIIGLEPHPNDKKNAYKKIVLSRLPKSL